MLNLYEGVRVDPSYNKLEIGDLLFAEYTCGIGDEKLGLWTHADYLVNVVTGQKTWHTSDGVWAANPGETLFFKKGAAIVEQHFELDFCLLVFFIPDDFARSTVREIAGSLTAAPAGAAAIKSAVHRSAMNLHLNGSFFFNRSSWNNCWRWCYWLNIRS